MMAKEDKYIEKGIGKARIQRMPFYLFRILPIKRKKIVFCCIEGTTGYTCNPKYIAEELIRRNNILNQIDSYELVWLVNDTSKVFPGEIKVVKNTLLNRAYHLTTAGFWIDNSRKQLEVRKRKGQIYIQTWHAKLGFKPTCLDRGASFPKIAYLVSKHDSDMIDYWLSNSDWYDKTLPTGSLYEGKILRTGSPRCDILIKAKNDKEFKNKIKEDICKKNQIHSEKTDDVHFLMYAPTFRGGSQGTDRVIENGNHTLDYKLLKQSLEKSFGGTWYILLRLHPQLVARNLNKVSHDNSLIDISKVDDMYEILAGCDAFMTDYSSAAFDAAVMEMPVFLYCDDYGEYEEKRGKLLWDLKELPFSFAENSRELMYMVESFDKKRYNQNLLRLFKENGMEENGESSKRVVDIMQQMFVAKSKRSIEE